jgi:mitochondrial import receptor subunit TOM22
MGLTEMFPEKIRDLTESIFFLTKTSVVSSYKFACSASWIFFTSSMVLFAPVIFETERAQMEELQKSQQKQVLLGPSANQPPLSR